MRILSILLILSEIPFDGINRIDRTRSTEHRSAKNPFDFGRGQIRELEVKAAFGRDDDTLPGSLDRNLNLHVGEKPDIGSGDWDAQSSRSRCVPIDNVALSPLFENKSADIPVASCSSFNLTVRDELKLGWIAPEQNVLLFEFPELELVLLSQPTCLSDQFPTPDDFQDIVSSRVLSQVGKRRLDGDRAIPGGRAARQVLRHVRLDADRCLDRPA